MAKIIKKIDSDISLVKRRRSKIIQGKYKDPSTGKLVFVSTGTKDIDDATVFMVRYFENEKYKVASGNVEKKYKAFEKIAKDTNRRLQQELNRGTGKVIYKDYIRVIKQYLIPYFGNKPIDKITPSVMHGFSQWRVKKMERVPSKSTLQTHNAAIRQVYQTAVNQDLINPWEVPSLSTKDGMSTNKRPYFDYSEYKQLYKFMRTWIKTGHSRRTRDLRTLLRDFVLIIANTGLRYGEAYNLKWNHVKQDTSSNDVDIYISLLVDGKTGEREVIARHSVLNYLKRIHKRIEHLKHLSFDDLLKVDEYVFQMPKGNRPNQFQHSFDQLLRDSKLTYDQKGAKRSIYSLRHTYVTFQLLNDDPIDLHTLALQIGSSAKMIETHYSHLKPLMKKRKLAGKPYYTQPPKELDEPLGSQVT